MRPADRQPHQHAGVIVPARPERDRPGGVTRRYPKPLLLGAVATFSTIRYWAAGFAGGGDSGFAALEGLTRTVGAALFLAIWPWLFDTAVSLTNLFTSSLLGSAAVVHSISHLLAAGLGAG